MKKIMILMVNESDNGRKLLWWLPRASHCVMVIRRWHHVIERDRFHAMVMEVCVSHCGDGRWFFGMMVMVGQGCMLGDEGEDYFDDGG